MRVELVVCGVGGQGVITAGVVLGEACVRAGFNVVTAETHGMSQRMGSVDFFVRIGDVLAPLVPQASADYVIALEMLEALRAVRYLRRCGWLILNDLHLPPPGTEGVPPRELVLKALAELPIRLMVVSGSKIAKSLGSPAAANIALLGAALATEPLSQLIPLHVVEEVVEEMLGPVNRAALLEGHKEALERLSTGEGLHVAPGCRG